MASRYEIINASDGVFSAPSEKGDGMVQPNTRRVLELDADFSDAKLEGYASGGIFIKKTNAAAENGQPLPGLDENIALARQRLMVAAGQERADIIAELRGEKKASTAAKSAPAPATTAAPSAAPAPTAATGPAAGR